MGQTTNWRQGVGCPRLIDAQGQRKLSHLVRARAGRYGLQKDFTLDFRFKSKFSLVGFDMDFPLGVKVQSETTSQKDKMAGPAIVSSDNVT